MRRSHVGVVFVFTSVVAILVTLTIVVAAAVAVAGGCSSKVASRRGRKPSRSLLSASRSACRQLPPRTNGDNASGDDYTATY